MATWVWGRNNIPHCLIIHYFRYTGINNYHPPQSVSCRDAPASNTLSKLYIHVSGTAVSRTRGS